MQLKMAGVSCCHTRDAGDASQQDAKKVSSAHVGVNHIELFALNPFANSDQLIGRKPVHFGLATLDPGLAQRTPNP